VPGRRLPSRTSGGRCREPCRAEEQRPPHAYLGGRSCA
jgi:hypothetical protein